MRVSGLPISAFISRTAHAVQGGTGADGERCVNKARPCCCLYRIARSYFRRMSTRDLHNPHDRFFREAFARRELAVGFLRDYLPMKVLSRLDAESLEITKDSYVDKELSPHYSDILYKAKIAGKPSYLYLLFEHKSYVDPLVGFQLLRNMV